MNIYSDHIDWHAGFENYKNAKLNVLNGSKYNLLRDEILGKYDFGKNELKELHIRTFGHKGNYSYQKGIFSIKKQEVFDNKNIILQGEHNMMNISAVVGICDIMKIDPKVLEKTLAEFKGLPHRMENI